MMQNGWKEPEEERVAIVVSYRNISLPIAYL